MGDHMTGELNAVPGRFISNPITEEDGKTYTVLSNSVENFLSEFIKRTKQDESKLQEVGERTEHGCFNEIRSIDMVDRLQPLETNSDIEEINSGNAQHCLNVRKYRAFDALKVNSDDCENTSQNYIYPQPETEAQSLSEPRSPSNSADEKDKQNNTFSCSVSSKSSTNKENLYEHIGAKSGEKVIAFKHSSTFHNGLHTRGKPYECATCHKSFTFKGSLNAHIRTHTDENPFTCEICHKAFTRKAHLTAHTRTHTGEKPYSCRLCGKSFAEKATLNNHTRTHTGQKPYSCGFCQKSFAQKGSLNGHIRTHTGEKPYSCEICQKSFSRKLNLMNHITQHTEPIFK